VRGEHHARPVRHLVKLVHEHRAAALQSATTWVLCTICLRTYTGGPCCWSSFSTISIARSTPAQNDRGPASRTRRWPAAAAHRVRAGPAARREAQRAQPAGQRGRAHQRPLRVSEMARITATGRSRPRRPATRTPGRRPAHRVHGPRPLPATGQPLHAHHRPVLTASPARRSSPPAAAPTGTR